MYYNRGVQGVYFFPPLYFAFFGGAFRGICLAGGVVYRLHRGGSVLSFLRGKESTKENAPSSAGRLAAQAARGLGLLYDRDRMAFRD